MKKIIVACLFIIVSFNLWGQSFELPQMTNTTNSIETAVRMLVDAARDIGNPDYKGDWNYSEEIFLSDMTAYLDSVLVNMNYASVRDYTRLIRTNIDSIDTQAISRNQWTNFENRLQHIYPNNGREVREMQDEYKIKSFPLTLNRNENAITEMTGQTQEYQRQLSEYQEQLNKLPTIPQLNYRQNEINRELLQPNVARNARLTKQLKDEETAIGRQKLEVDRECNRLNRLISEKQTQLRNSDVDNLITNMDATERNRIISSTWTSLYNFYEWERFFINENTCLKDFFYFEGNKTEII